MLKALNILVATLLVMVIAVAGFILYVDNQMGEEVVEGTFLDSKDISGLTKQQVTELVAKQVKLKNGNTVTLKLNKQQKTFTWSQLGIVYKEKDLVDAIFKDQSGNALEKVKVYLTRKSTPKQYKVEQFFEEDIFASMFEKSFPDTVSKPVNATLKIAGEKIQISGGTPGKSVNESVLKERVLAANLEGSKTVEVPLTEIEPEVTKKDIQDMGITKIIASYETYYDSGAKGKTTNISIASEDVDGAMLAPGEVFDFFAYVGRVTAEQGYVDAPVYSGGQSIDDIGGGICQVSSTLYNAALLAGFEIVERHQHGLPVSYVPAGRDATLWYGSKNFRFKNTSGKHSYVQVVNNNGTLTINIFGTKNVGKVNVESQVTERIEPPVREILDPTLNEGEVEVVKSGVSGYKSIAYRTIESNGIAKRVELSRDHYKPMERVIRVGTKSTASTEE